MSAVLTCMFCLSKSRSNNISVHKQVCGLFNQVYIFHTDSIKLLLEQVM